MMYDYGYRNNYDVWGSVLMFFLMILVVIGTVAIIRYFVRSNASNQLQETALEILKKRYAKGEIDKHGFDAMRKDLKD